jgi:formylglycine-generating enzyme required for sulfatase activity
MDEASFRGRWIAFAAAIAIAATAGGMWVRGLPAKPERAEMVFVPAGSFVMGCNERGDGECTADERPERAVEVKGFEIDKTEVTVAAYRVCVDSGPCSADGLETAYWKSEHHASRDQNCNWARPSRNAHPINCVTWEQASAYCHWMGKRLPTEAEWEKAARGTDGRTYPWGNEAPSCDRANISGCGEGTEEVGGRVAGASPYGALDMAGNVWEWTSDWYEVGTGRSTRGGSWNLAPANARASARFWGESGGRSPGDGFRCVR